jgi:hypothetical protein
VLVHFLTPGCRRSMLMRFLVPFTLAIVFAPPAVAQQATCILQAIEKKLTGPARSDFLEKCEVSVRDSCEKLAEQRRFSAAEKTLFMNACVPMFVGLPKP